MNLDTCVLSLNLVSWTHASECLDSTLSINRWPFFLMPLVFTETTLTLLHVGWTVVGLVVSGQASRYQYNVTFDNSKLQHRLIDRVVPIELPQLFKVIE